MMNDTDIKEYEECKNLHEFIYIIVYKICIDKDYLYLSFTKNFCALMDEIFHKGRVNECGHFSIDGIKSNIIAKISWRIARRMNFTGFNCVSLRCIMIDKIKSIEIEDIEYRFDLSTGDVVK